MRNFTLLLCLLFVSTTLFAQPANDECVNAIQLPDELEFCTDPGILTNEGGSPSFPDYPACIDEEDQYRDVWYSFTAQATDVSVNVVGDVDLLPGGTLLTPQFLLYGGTCDNLTEIGCVSPIIGFNSVAGIFTGLIPGETYFINVGARIGRQGTFQICLNQFNSVPEPDGDCGTGVVLCDKSSFAVNFLSGRGNVNDDLGDLLCNENNCSGNGQVPEANSAWYKWTCDQPGTLTFTIDPLGGPNDDLDFLLYELPNGLDDCDSKVNIRCMLSGETQGNTDAENLPCLNETGLSEFDGDDLEECGCQNGNNNFARALDMEAGRSYALVIMNFSNSGSGFNISFGGTGTFVGPEASFTTDLGQACVGELVTFTDNSTSLDPIDGYTWNFGTNASPSTATGPGPHQVFFNQPGNQTILLAVETNRGCLVTEIQSNLEIICCADHFDVTANINDTQCPGDGTGAINLNASSGFAPLSFNWSTGATTASISGLEPGDYTVTISDEATCEAVRTFTVGGPPAFTFDTLITMPTCDGGQDGALTLAVNGGTPGYEFSFDNAPFGPNNTISNIPIGTYNVRVRDANGCETEQDIFVNELVLELDPLVASIQEPRCNGESNGRITVNINNGLGPYEYDFDDGNGFQASSILDNIPTGTYQVEVRDANNCRGTFSFDVPDPPSILVTLDASNISCFGEVDGLIDAAVDGGRPGYTYSWSNNANSPSIMDLTAGTYTLTVTDQNGCPEIVDTFIIEPNEIFGELVEVIDNICFGENGGTIRLTASGGTPGFEYSLDGTTFQLDSVFNNLAAGAYTLTVLDARGCTDTVNATIAQPAEFIIDPGRDILLDLGFDTTLNAVSNYRPVQFSWGPDSVQCLNFDCSRVLVRPVVGTTYVVTGVNEAGCVATAEVLVRVVDNKPVYIPNAFTPDGDGINDGFTLFAGPAVAAIENLQIFDRWGGLLFEAAEAFLPNQPGQGWNGNAGDRPVNAGVYIYKFQVRFINGEVLDYAGDVTVVR